MGNYTEEPPSRTPCTSPKRGVVKKKGDRAGLVKKGTHTDNTHRVGKKRRIRKKKRIK